MVGVLLSHVRAQLSQEERDTHSHEPMYDQWIVEGGVEMNVEDISSSRGVERSEHTESATRLLVGNDPSAGSPTETLLRLLLPLSIRI